MDHFRDVITGRLEKYMTGGRDETNYDRNDLAKRSNEQLALNGKKVTVKQVKETEFFMGC